MKAPTYLLTILSLFAILACMCGEPSNSSTSAPSSPSVSAPTPAARVPVQVLAVDAASLMADYKNNEVSADIKYKGKLLKVTGKVGDIKKDFMGNIYVTVGTGAMFEIPAVQAFFDDADTAKAASLNKGQRITVVGRCDGLMMNVMLKDSKFAE